MMGWEEGLLLHPGEGVGSLYLYAMKRYRRVSFDCKTRRMLVKSGTSSSFSEVSSRF